MELDKRKLNELLDAAERGGKLGAEAAEFRQALQTGSLDGIMRSLKPEDAQKVQKLLNDKEALMRLLSTPRAREILKKLTE